MFPQYVLYAETRNCSSGGHREHIALK